jgi:acetolactate synthase-1/3 small subunit
VQNEPGVLSRVSGILAARGFNIDSLVVCSTEVADLSRMTIVLQGQDGVVEQARRQLEDLVPVWAVLDYTAAPLVQRELLLAKVSILGPEYFEELLAHHREMTGDAPPQQELPPQATATDGSDAAEKSFEEQEFEYPTEPFHPSALPPSEALRLKHQHLETITYLTHQFGGKVLDISTNNCIVELSAKPHRIDSFMKLITPFGILESARTGEIYSVQLCDSSDFKTNNFASPSRSDGTSSFTSSRSCRRDREGHCRHCRHQPAASQLDHMLAVDDSGLRAPADPRPQYQVLASLFCFSFPATFLTGGLGSLYSALVSFYCQGSYVGVESQGVSQQLPCSTLVDSILLSCKFAPGGHTRFNDPVVILISSKHDNDSVT